MKKLLPSAINRYRGRWVGAGLPSNIHEFERNLSHSIEVWQSEGIKVIWLPIPATQAALIPIAIEQGFHFHHTRDNTVTLTKRLVDKALIPDFANHTIGVGAIVFNDNNEILTIVEKHDIKERPGHWKFPGGGVDPGELIRDAAVRETREETGIEAKFIHVVGMRHYHQGQFGTSNIYVVCRMQALTNEITPCPEEIAQAKWFDIDDYLISETVIEFNKQLLRAALSEHGMADINLGTLNGVLPKAYEFFCV